jgi:hypothetical protein
VTGRKLGKKYRLKDPKGRKLKNKKRQREHDRKEEPQRGPVVPNRRCLYSFPHGFNIFYAWYFHYNC